MTGAASLNLGGSGRVGLLLAGILAILAGLLVYLAVRDRGGDDGESVSTPTSSTIEIVRAVEDIPARTEITAEMIEVVRVPRDGSLAGAVNSEALIVGRTTRIPIYQGEQFMPEKLTSLSALTASSLAYIIPEGHRAMAVTASKLSTAGGLVRPGDHVDVMVVVDLEFTDPVDGGEVSETRSITIAQNVEVLAVEQALQNRLTNEPEVSEGSPVDQPAPQPDATVVTLAVTPAEAELVFLANDRGEIRLSIRPPGDDSIVELPGMTFISLSDPEFARFLEETLGGTPSTP